MASNDTDDTRPTKRAREATTYDTADPSKCKRSERYWFEDGNIVLLVGDLLFRVYRGILSHHSPVFRDMFAIPQPASLAEDLVVDGCGVVVLPGDEPDDWECLFRVMHDNDTAYKAQGPLDSKTLISMLHLGRKYQFDVFFNAAMERIGPCFLTTLDGWSSLSTELIENDPGVIEFLSLMVEIGNQTILPTLYFYCATSFTMDAIFQKCILDARNKAFPPKAFQNIIAGRAEICELYKKEQLSWVSLQLNREHRKQCSNNPSSLCHRTVVNSLQKYELWEYSYLTLEPAQKLFGSILEENDVCAGCRTAISAAHEQSRATLWENLPSYFGLPAWGDLKDL